MRPPLDGCDPDNSLLSAHVLTKLCFSNFTELCNSADPEFREYLINNDGIDLTIKALTSANEETVLSAITTLIYIGSPKARRDIVVDLMKQFVLTTDKPRLVNLAQIFLNDFGE